jgi:two-component system, OmpR family, sensor kinase
MLLKLWNSTPIAIQMPLLAGIAVFFTAVATTQVATVTLGREAQRDAARLGAVYLDGLASALAEPLRRGDLTALRAAMQGAMTFQEGIRERRLEVVLPDTAGTLVAGSAFDTALSSPVSRGQRDAVWQVAPDGRTAWAQRSFALPDGRTAILAAELDFSEAVERRQRLARWLLVLDFALAALAGLVAALLARRAQAPMLAVVRTIGRAGGGDFVRTPADAVPTGTEAARLMSALDLMMARLDEREQLARRLAERDRAAELGELAATVAHEVRNPLAGMLTAIDSARRFGADAQARGESLDLLERGLRQIQRVVDDTLAAYRGTVEVRPLEQADIDDVLRLLAPEAMARRVTLHRDGVLEAPFATDAVPVRQALLNLLLNAVQATPRGGSVRLRIGGEADGRLLIEVEDQGGGLPEAHRRRLEGADATGPGLGLTVVMRELARLDGEIGVFSEPGRSTRITIRLPPRRELAP